MSFPLADIRIVTPRFSVAPQISVEDLSGVKAAGYGLVINNRPDGEIPGQPTSAAMAAAAQGQGLAYRHIPVSGSPTPDQVRAMAEAVDGQNDKVLAFCRSGTRSIITWSLGQTGVMSRDEIIRCGAAAGYDLSAVVR